MTTKETQTGTQLSTTGSGGLAMVGDNVVDEVASRVSDLCQDGQLHLPTGYSPENAMKAAWLTLQGVADKNKKPALEVCTKNSVANSLLDMVIQGLNPGKKQCYFVVYGKTLVCMRSYFGSMALLKRVYPDVQFWAEVVYQGDQLEYEIVRGRKTIKNHIQSLDNVDDSKISAAYCVIEPGDGREPHTEIMTIEQIKAAWRMGQAYSDKGNGAHQKFGGEMAKKTVINRGAKRLINSSDDSYLVMATRRADEALAEAEIEEDVALNANKELIDIEAEVSTDETAEPNGDGEKKEQSSIDGPGF